MNEAPPAAVYLALICAYALAAMLLIGGFLGFLTWKAVGDVVGVGSTILGFLVLGATFIAWRGSRAGRLILGLLAAVCAVSGAIYMFRGPGSAFITSLVVALLGVGLVYALFIPEKSKRFFAEA